MHKIIETGQTFGELALATVSYVSSKLPVLVCGVVCIQLAVLYSVYNSLYATSSSVFVYTIVCIQLAVLYLCIQ